MAEKTCPLCHNAKRMNKPKVLYGIEVCRKCYYSFANRRQIAYLIDAICYGIITWSLLLPLDHVCAAMGLGFVVSFSIGLVAGVILAMVFAFKDGFSGHSLGKKLFGVQVVDRTTMDPIGFTRSFKRNWLLAIPYVSIIFVLMAVFQMVKGPRVGDGMARTKVIWKKYRSTKVFSPDEPYCENCSYDLRGNVSGVCPECGQPISEVNQNLINAIGATPAVAPPVA